MDQATRHRWLNRFVLICTFLTYVAWSLVGVAVVVTAGANDPGYKGNRPPEAGFAGMELVYVQLPLWLLCFVPGFLLTICALVNLLARWNYRRAYWFDVLPFIPPPLAVPLYFTLREALRMTG